MNAPRYAVGIDLGTTHCVVAASPLDQDRIRIEPILQLIAPGETARRDLLPSFLYLPMDGELSRADRRLPWSDAGPVIGELARRRGAQVPDRLVASAKSWICHGGVNRRAPILPWSAPEGIPQLSPFDASVHSLRHLREAWDAAHPDAPLAQQEVVVTVPASFDEVARALTVDAAREAGLPQLRLLEEPQAAFHDFLGEHQADLTAALGAARLVLVVDVGGGTTDLTLVRISPNAAGAPALERIAVGGHLMLGGDNMDAALAHHVLQQAGIDRALDPTEWAALVQSARDAKERLLAADAPPEAHLTLQRRGRRLIGGTIGITLERETARAVILDGFLPRTAPHETADRRGRAGLTTLGLPYTTDAAIPRHVNTFLRKHAHAAAQAGAQIFDGLPRPDLLLLNGGVFNAPALMTRLQEVIDAWYPGAPVPVLPGSRLDTAVARGAARSILARRGLSPRIGGGTARAYYIGIEGADGARQALCLAPKGMEEGATVEVRDHPFQLMVDRPVSFALYGYPGERTDLAGALIPLPDEALEALPPVETLLRRQGDLWLDPSTGGVPVRPTATLTEAGTLELHLVTIELPPRRWRLEFDLSATGEPAVTLLAAQQSPPPPPEASPEPLPRRFDEVRRAIDRIFGGGRQGHDPGAAKGLRRELEGVLGPRGDWNLTVCRAVADALLQRAERRGSTPEHELNWLRLLSWGLRPGLGFSGDTDRLDRLWSLQAEGLCRPEIKGNWGEWWVLWRRIAAGLSAPRQRTLFDAVAPWLRPPKGPPPPGPRAHGHPEMLRMLGSLDRLSPDAKQQAGQWLRDHFKKVNSWWALGRLGARTPFHGDASTTVPAPIAADWLEELLALDWSQADGAAYAAVMIARVTGDPARDIAEPLRARIASRLTAAGASPHWIEQVSRQTNLDEADTKRILGEALPAGLRLT